VQAGAKRGFRGRRSRTLPCGRRTLPTEADHVRDRPEAIFSEGRTYTVHLTSGDPSFIDGVYRRDMGRTLNNGKISGGVPAVSGAPTASNHRFSNTVTVTVTNVVLYVGSGAGSSNNMIHDVPGWRARRSCSNANAGEMMVGMETARRVSDATGGQLRFRRPRLTSRSGRPCQRRS
jgi:hypothetical protein